MIYIKKTVRDAVIELKGEWPYPHENHMTRLTEHHAYEFAIDDFNTYVDLLASNMGRVSDVEMSNYINDTLNGLAPVASKENQTIKKESESMSESQAIEKIRATPEMHGEVSKYGGNLMYNKSNAAIYWVSGDDDETAYSKWSDTSKSFNPFEWRNNGLKGLDLIIIKHDEYKEQSPVYTQEDADNVVLPSVGSCAMLKISTEYFTNRSKLAGQSVYITSHFKTNGGKELCSFVNHEESDGGVAAACAFEPIDTRTDKEKADDLFKFYLKGENTSTHKSFSQAVVDGDFGDNVTWSKS